MSRVSRVQWRPELNVLTTPCSYRARVIPIETIGLDRLAQLVSVKNRLWSADMIASVVRAVYKEIIEQLCNGRQVSLENLFTYHLTIAARLDAPTDPLPPESTVNVQGYAARALGEEVRKRVRLERMTPVHKTPMIISAEDSVLGLANVLNPNGLLRLTGADLLFNPAKDNGECVLEGTNSGRAVQTRLARVTNGQILALPIVPAQTEPWHNEYRVSVTTRYSEYGSTRTGTYDWRLRSPLSVVLGTNPGILSSSGASPLVTVSDGTLAVEQARVRIAAVFNAQTKYLDLQLLDMQAKGNAGERVQVNGNGVYTLPGLADSPLTALEVTVHGYDDLVALVREGYGGQLVDILDLQATP